jgi:choline dehydrogenase-like flavoprotein
MYANYLTTEYDRKMMIECARQARHIFGQKAFAPFRGEEIYPGADLATDEELMAFIRRKSESIYHPVGTCKMGQGPEAVVNEALQVHGLEALRVVDASIMPSLVSGNTNAPTIMIAEKCVAELNH